MTPESFIPLQVRAAVYILGIVASAATEILNGFGYLTGDQQGAIMSGLAMLMGGFAVGHLNRPTPVTNA